MSLWIVVTGLSLGCQQPPARPRELTRADAVAAADLDGDGADEPVLVLDGVATWPGGEADLGGGLSASARYDPDGDGREALLLGTGMTRDMREAPARVWRLDEDGASLLWEGRGPRNQVTDLRVLDGKIWLATYADRASVAGGWLEGGEHRVLLREKYANRQLPLGEDSALVGRIYGDKPKSDGDLRLMTKGSAPRVLPTLRGVRSLTAADLDGDGADELLVGDGWHYAYGQRAVARVRLLEAPRWERGRTVASFDGEYTVREIAVSGGDILALGTGALHLLRRDDLGWSDTVLAQVDETGSAALFQDPSGPAVLVSGSPARIIPLPR